jgi:hypothetical protein
LHPASQATPEVEEEATAWLGRAEDGGLIITRVESEKAAVPAVFVEE